LEKLTLFLFGSITKKDVKIPEWDYKIYSPKLLVAKTVVVPVKDIRNLSVSFLIPDQKENYKSKVKIFVNYLHNFNTKINVIN